MPIFSQTDFNQFVVSFQNSVSFFLSSFRGLLITIKSYPLLYVPLILFLLIGLAFWFILFVQEISNSIGNSFYPYSNIYKNGSSVFHFFYQKYVHRYDKKIAKEKFLSDWSKVDKYFSNNPNSLKVSYNGITYFADNWYNKSYSKNGVMRHSTSYKKGLSGTWLPVRQSHTITEYDDIN